MPTNWIFDSWADRCFSEDLSTRSVLIDDTAATYTNNMDLLDNMYVACDIDDTAEKKYLITVDDIFLVYSSAFQSNKSLSCDHGLDY